MTDPNDDLAEVLAPKLAESSSLLRERLLRQTESRLKRSRWVRRGVRSGLIAAVFFFGVLAGRLALPRQVPEPIETPQPEIIVVPVVVPILAPSGSGSSELARGLTGHQTELQAEQEDDPSSAAKLYKMAGDTYLREEDYPNAARCYRLFLVRGGDAALSLSPDDSWLLSSIKNAAFQEKSRAQKTDS
jgi:hypothetical protein